MKKILTLLLALTIVAASAALAPVSVFAAEPGWIYDFSTEGSAEDFSTQTSGASILSDGENGYTRFYSLAGDAWLSHAASDLDGSANPIFVTYYRTTSVDKMQLYVNGADGKAYGADGTVKDDITYVKDGEWHAVYADLTDLESYASGVVFNLRFDFACNEGVVDVLFIAAFANMAEAEAYVAAVKAPSDKNPGIYVDKEEIKESEQLEVIYAFAGEGCSIAACKKGTTDAVTSVAASGSGKILLDKLPAGEYDICLISNGSATASVPVTVTSVAQLSEADSAKSDAERLMIEKCYTAEYKDMVAAYNELIAAGDGADAKALIDAIAAYRNSLITAPLNLFKTSSEHTETFESEDDFDSSVWESDYPQDGSVATFADGWYVLNWVNGNNITYYDFFEKAVYTFDMKINPGAAHGFGLKVDKAHGLYGGGRNCAGDDIGKGISVDLITESNKTQITVGFNSGTGMLKAPRVSINYPEGFDPKTENSFKVYDYGNIINIFINDAFFCRIELELDEEGLLFDKAYVYNSANELVGTAEDIGIETEGSCCFYTRAGNTYVKNVTISSLSVEVPEGEETPVPPTEAPSTDAAEPTETGNSAGTPTKAPAKKKGCGSVIGGGVAVAAVMAAAAVIIARKKED